MAPADAIRSQLATIPDYSVQRTLRLVADALDAIALVQSRQASGQQLALTTGQLSQIKAALEASGTHPLQLTGLQQSGFQTFVKSANEFLDSFTASTGQFTASQPSASTLSNGVTGTGAVVLATSPTLVTPNIGVATGSGGTLTSYTLADPVSTTSLPVYANNAAAILGGLAVGRLYQDGSDPSHVCVVF